jgi:hypothetical protein
MAYVPQRGDEGRGGGGVGEGAGAAGAVRSLGWTPNDPSNG